MTYSKVREESVMNCSHYVQPMADIDKVSASRGAENVRKGPAPLSQGQHVGIRPNGPLE